MRLQVLAIFTTVYTLSLSAFAVNGDIETVTTGASTGVTAVITATTVQVGGTIEQVTVKCGTNTCSLYITTVPVESTVPGFKVFETNGITGNVTFWPRVSGEKPFIWGESLTITATNIAASVTPIQATIKLSK